MTVDNIRPLLGQAGFAPSCFTEVYFPELDSTNEEARRQIHQGAAPGLVISAGQQKAGRGRRGRSWFSPPGNLYMTIILSAHPDRLRNAEIGFAAALAMAYAIEELCPAMKMSVQVKWPNDLLLNRRKLGGILLEWLEIAGGSPYLTAGIGVNLALYPEDVPYPATSLWHESGVQLEPADLRTAFCIRFLDWLHILDTEGFSPLRSAWLSRSAFLNETITILSGSETLVGRYRGIDTQGFLQLEQRSGRIRAVTTGEVAFISSA